MHMVRVASFRRELLLLLLLSSMVTSCRRELLLLLSTVTSFRRELLLLLLLLSMSMIRIGISYNKAMISSVSSWCRAFFQPLFFFFSFRACRRPCALCTGEVVVGVGVVAFATAGCCCEGSTCGGGVLGAVALCRWRLFGGSGIGSSTSSSVG